MAVVAVALAVSVLSQGLVPWPLESAAASTMHATAPPRQPAVPRIVAELDDRDLPQLDGMEASAFRELVTAALGIEDVGAATVSESPESEAYRGGELRTGLVSYDALGVNVSYLYATHGDAGRTLVTVLHGHFSSAAKVMGLDEPDYMQAVGAELFDRGYDVLALDTTSGMTESEYLNGQLALYGVQIYGLWADAAIRASRHYEADYETMGLYGLSNGGLIAQFVSAVDASFDVVIVGDILQDWRATAKEHPSLHTQQNYSLFFLAPLWAQARPADFVEHAMVPTWYTGTSATRAALDGQVDSDRIVAKTVEAHVPEVDLIVSLIERRDDDTTAPQHRSDMAD